MLLEKVNHISGVQNQCDVVVSWLESHNGVSNHPCLSG